MGEVTELLARLEAATGPDRELDAAIIRAFGGKRILDDWWIGYRFIGREIPNFTASIDAALTLAEDKDETLREALRWLNKRFHLHINPWPEGENYVQWLALAIVIAALRATEARQQ